MIKYCVLKGVTCWLHVCQPTHGELFSLVLLPVKEVKFRLLDPESETCRRKLAHQGLITWLVGVKMNSSYTIGHICGNTLPGYLPITMTSNNHNWLSHYWVEKSVANRDRCKLWHKAKCRHLSEYWELRMKDRLTSFVAIGWLWYSVCNKCGTWEKSFEY